MLAAITLGGTTDLSQRKSGEIRSQTISDELTSCSHLSTPELSLENHQPRNDAQVGGEETDRLE